MNSVDTQTVIEKACHHFRLGPIQEELALIGEVDGVECELTDDILKLLPRGAVVALTKIQQENCPGDDSESTNNPPAYILDLEVTSSP